MRVSHNFTSAMSQYGYALIRNYKPKANSLEALSDFGRVDILEGLNPIQTLIPRNKADAPLNTYSGNFGVAEFPLHTDLAHWAIPPRFLALRCIHGTASIATRLLDGQDIKKHFGSVFLRTILVQPRRRMRNGKQILQLLERIETSNEFRIRWDSIYLRPATESSSEPFANVLSFVSCAQPYELILLERGDTLLIDNWRCLHGRASKPDNSVIRQVDRAYLESIP